jgi:flagella basal body P-ring formation protein FlgA
VVSRGSSFAVTAEGRALNNAAEGQLAQVRMASGQTVSGIARADGSVEISF